MAVATTSSLAHVSKALQTRGFSKAGAQEILDSKLPSSPNDQKRYRVLVSKIPQSRLSQDLKQITLWEDVQIHTWNYAEMTGGIIAVIIVALLFSGWGAAVVLLVGGVLWICFDYKFQAERVGAKNILSDIFSRLSKIKT